MKNFLILIFVPIFLFSCKNDEDNIPLTECSELTRIQVNSDFEIIEFPENFICNNWNSGNHYSYVSFPSDLIVLEDANVSAASIRTSSKTEGTYEIVNHEEFVGEVLPAGTAISMIQTYKDTIIISGENDNYNVNSGIVTISNSSEGKIIKCIKDGEFTSLKYPSKSFTASLTIVCDE